MTARVYFPIGNEAVIQRIIDKNGRILTGAIFVTASVS